MDDVIDQANHICDVIRWRGTTVFRTLHWERFGGVWECHEYRDDPATRSTTSRIIAYVTEYADCFAGPCMHCGAEHQSSMSPAGAWVCSDDCESALEVALDVMCVHCGSEAAVTRDLHHEL